MTDEYRLLRNKVSTMIETAKKAYQTNTEGGKDDPRSIWKLFKRFGMCKKVSSKINNFEFEIKTDNNIISDNLDISHVFNEYFVTFHLSLKSQ